MQRTFKGTNAAEIQNAITEGRHNVGAASGMVFTLVVIADLYDYAQVLAACTDAGREHPSRMIIVTNGTAKADRLDAEVYVGEDVPGEILSLRFQGELQNHRETVVLPLLLPDSPVIAWWPGTAPASLAEDPLGRLATRRISDAMGARDPLEALETRALHLTPGDTDLTWTRLTPWRAILASSLDQVPAKVKAASVKAEPDNAAGILLAAWLDDRLPCPVTVEVSSSGPGVNTVVLATEAGDISITRTDGRMASYSAPGTPRRVVALRRREVSVLITEELRRLDADDILGSAMKRLLKRVRESERAEAAREDPGAELAAAKETQVE